MYYIDVILFAANYVSLVTSCGEPLILLHFLLLPQVNVNDPAYGRGKQAWKYREIDCILSLTLLALIFAPFFGFLSLILFEW